MSRATRAARRREKVLSFASCEFCSFDLATGEGERSCHYFECPYIPEDLVVTCPTCNYNFFTREGSPECNEGGPACEFRRVEAPVRVATLREWLMRNGRDPSTGLPIA